MSKEIIDATLLRLRGSVIETFEAIKDLYAAPASEGTVDQIAQLASRLAALEGGLLTLQQYAPLIEEQVRAKKLEEAIAVTRHLQKEEDEQTASDLVEEAATPSAITTEELEKRSPTYRRSQTAPKKAAPKKAAAKKAAPKRKPQSRTKKKKDE